MTKLEVHFATCAFLRASYRACGAGDADIYEYLRVVGYNPDLPAPTGPRAMS